MGANSMTGFDSKRDMAADKVQEDLINYGTAWSQDGKRIDPMSVYKEPAQEPVVQPAPGYCKNCKDYTIEEPLYAQPAQESPASVERRDGAAPPMWQPKRIPRGLRQRHPGAACRWATRAGKPCC